MKKTILMLAACLLCVVLLTTAALADESGEWNVTFTSDAQMKAEFTSAEITKIINDMQPGDSMTFRFNLKNQNEKSTRWYMTNTTIKSLEDGSIASGGAYVYRLTYITPTNISRDIYKSDTVGGEDPDSAAVTGLYEATNAIKELTYLDILDPGQEGTLVLHIELEGETQGNSYQNTSANVRLNFAVELAEGKGKPVKTGDDTNLFPFYVGMAAAALLMLTLALDAYTEKKYRIDVDTKGLR